MGLTTGFDDTFFAGTVLWPFERLLRGLVTLFIVVVDRRVVGPRLLHGFAGRIFVDMACILVFLEVFVGHFFPNVFAASESAFLLTADFFKGGCGGWEEGRRFDVTRRDVDSGGSCSSTRRTGALPRVERAGIAVEASDGPASTSELNRTCRRLPQYCIGGAGDRGSSERLESRVLLCERVRGPELAATSSRALEALD